MLINFIFYILYFNYMYKRIKCMWNKLLYLNFILYNVTLVADLSRKIKIFYYIMLQINFMRTSIN